MRSTDGADADALASTKIALREIKVLKDIITVKHLQLATSLFLMIIILLGQRIKGA